MKFRREIKRVREKERERERETTNRQAERSAVGSVRSALLGRISVPVVDCRLLTRPVRWSRIPPWSRNQLERQQGRHLGESGPSPERRLNRALGSAYLPPRGTPCPPLLPPRRPLAKREQRRELSFTDPLLGRTPVYLVILFCSFLCFGHDCRVSYRQQAIFLLPLHDSGLVLVIDEVDVLQSGWNCF